VPATEALALAEERRSELLDLLAAMIRIKSLSGESAAAAQGVVKDYLGKLPYRIEESADRPSRFEKHLEYMPPNPPGDGPFVNVVGWPQRAAGRQYAMFAHIDTHSMDDGWHTDPLEPVVDGKRLYGLGTSDDKGGVAAMLVAAAVLVEAGVRPPVVMSLHGKGGGSRGSLPVFDRLQKSDHGIGAVLYVHPAETGRGLEDIKARRRWRSAASIPPHGPLVAMRSIPVGRRCNICAPRRSPMCCSISASWTAATASARSPTKPVRGFG
jgi:acetylornithine deacetylase/succinyl-diaminopimelate desuccinylase-like protein